MTLDTSGKTQVQKTYNLRGLTWNRIGENRIQIVTPNPEKPVEFNLKDFNEVCMGLGFHQYLQDTSDVSGGSGSGSGSGA